MNSMGWQQTLAELPLAHGGPVLSGVIKQQPADFMVEEQLGFVTLSLGPRILRTATAALAEITASQLLWGDMG